MRSWREEPGDWWTAGNRVGDFAFAMTPLVVIVVAAGGGTRTAAAVGAGAGADEVAFRVVVIHVEIDLIRRLSTHVLSCGCWG